MSHACWEVFVGGISDRDGEEEVGDFFSQWGLVTLVYRDKASWGFVHFATKEGAMRVLEESGRLRCGPVGEDLHIVIIRYSTYSIYIFV